MVRQAKEVKALLDRRRLVGRLRTHAGMGLVGGGEWSAHGRFLGKASTHGVTLGEEGIWLNHLQVLVKPQHLDLLV